MDKFFKFALLVAISLPAMAIAQEAALSETENTSTEYKLDAEKIKDKLEAQSLKEENGTPSVTSTEENMQEDPNAPKKVTEETPEGTVEKLVTKDGLVLAEKTTKDGEVVQKVLNYYYPSGKLQRRITSLGEDKGFYAESYYPNGKVAEVSNYLNENNKVGKEKKYDINGVLRQEIPWELPKGDEKKPLNEQKTIRKGNVLTYYPNGRIAASFPVGYNGKTVFFDQRGQRIKTLTNVNILNFAPEMSAEECQNASIKLSLEGLVELYEDEGDISYNKCGLPYRENYKYEIAESTSGNTSLISFDDTGMIRRITPYQNGLKEGIMQKFDGSGNLTAEINYRNGFKDGKAYGYFPTREVAFRKRYENGKVQDKLTCYFPTGEVAAEITYKDGLKEGIAKIYGENGREIEFKEGKLVDAPDKNAPRILEPSKLSELTNIDDKCLNVDSKLADLREELEANENTITQSFTLNIPEECSDLSQYKPSKNVLACYDKNKVLSSTIPVSYQRGDFINQTVFGPDNKVLYNIPHYQKKRQGFAKQLGKYGKVMAEVYFNQGELAETSRTYYDNGSVKEILTIADGAPRKVTIRYAENGDLLFNMNYRNNERIEAFLADTEKNKDIFVKFYNNNIDVIREMNAGNPANYIMYNLALGEYLVYNNGELIKGGKLCEYDTAQQKVATNVNKEPQKEETKATEETKVADTSAPAKNEIEPAEVMEFPDITEEEDVKASASQDTDTSATKEAEPMVATPQIETIKKISEGIKEEKAPIMTEEEAPMIEDVQPVSMEDFKTMNAIIPTEAEKKQAELAAKNIGPVATPGINELTDVVSKQTLDVAEEKQTEALSKTEKFYYPNGSLRKTVKTKGNRTEEIKEYSKNGRLLTDKMYNENDIVIEKYSGNGELLRKSTKAYTDNPVIAFISRIDFYDSGKMRYEISRTQDTLLFSDKKYNQDGNLTEETIQTAPLSYMVKKYDKEGKLSEAIETIGQSTLIKQYDANGNTKGATLDNKNLPENMLRDSSKVLQDNGKVYAKSGAVVEEFKSDDKSNSLVDYYNNGKPKTEIIFYNSGEISVKTFSKAGNLEKFAYLSADGRLNIQKPEVRMIPSYRERYWVDYNNPRWIENQDRYSVKSIARLNLDTAAYILEELNTDIPELMRKIYNMYQ